MEKYDHKTIETKWQRLWEKEGIYKARDFDDRKKRYLLVEFPYPSGEGLHIGHAFTNTIGDVAARFFRMRGENVLFPMGWDAFGLPTENSAIKLGIPPAELTKKNTANFKRQNIALGMSFDWEREIDTSNPDYYEWTQWIFLKLYEKGLAYKEETLVGWCPSCKIILANEEIVNGKCERCGTEITYRKQKQWLLKITAYADRLSDELDLVDYPEYVKKSQRDWIGRKEWIDITYPIEGSDKEITVSTTRPDTNFGATFVVLAPEHPLVEEMLGGKFKLPKETIDEIRQYVEKAKNKSELERISEGRAKTGVSTGLFAVNRLNGQRLPLFITDFVVMNVGTGAVVGVPGHDRRDFQFAEEFKLPVKRVVVGEGGDKSEIDSIKKVFEGEGTAVNSDFLNGLDTKTATKKVMDYLEEKKWGQRVVRYHLRDWVFSRQHYWGEPIPIINCPNCGMVPVPEEDLPVTLPKVEKYQPTETGESPLANIKEWVEVQCPKCKGKAKRETDTMPNWAGSSWYYLAYLLEKEIKTKTAKNIFLDGEKKLNYWMPVDTYIGGAEHTTLHLLYSRFWHKFLNDLEIVPGKEPYHARRQHGVILAEDGTRMSKSRGNVVNPGEIVEKFGADTLRLYLMFLGPYDSTMAWNTSGVEGMGRFISRIWKLVKDYKEVNSQDENKLLTLMHQTIKKVTTDIEHFRYNTAISQLMVFVNLVSEKGGNRKALETLTLLLSPFAPHLSEEIWQTNFADRKRFETVHLHPWPEYDPKQVDEDIVTVVVQVNGKVRSQLKTEREVSQSKEEMTKLAEKDETVQKWIKGNKVKNVIFVTGRLLNFVLEK